ncbi:hypothetical protein C2E23DRAFT_461946 [Lenzites betulinus]|nr:hypothetical protein C2E23DRAFT_461946 [Lenzites betulinus]
MTIAWAWTRTSRLGAPGLRSMDRYITFHNAYTNHSPTLLLCNTTLGCKPKPDVELPPPPRPCRRPLPRLLSHTRTTPLSSGRHKPHLELVRIRDRVQIVHQRVRKQLPPRLRPRLHILRRAPAGQRHMHRRRLQAERAPRLPEGGARGVQPEQVRLRNLREHRAVAPRVDGLPERRAAQDLVERVLQNGAGQGALSRDGNEVGGVFVRARRWPVPSRLGFWGPGRAAENLDSCEGVLLRARAAEGFGCVA